MVKEVIPQQKCKFYLVINHEDARNSQHLLGKIRNRMIKKCDIVQQLLQTKLLNKLSCYLADENDFGFWKI